LSIRARAEEFRYVTSSVQDALSQTKMLMHAHTLPIFTHSLTHTHTHTHAHIHTHKHTSTHMHVIFQSKCIHTDNDAGEIWLEVGNCGLSKYPVFLLSPFVCLSLRRWLAHFPWNANTACQITLRVNRLSDADWALASWNGGMLFRASGEHQLCTPSQVLKRERRKAHAPLCREVVYCKSQLEHPF